MKLGEYRKLEKKPLTHKSKEQFYLFKGDIYGNKTNINTFLKQNLL